MKTQFYLAMVFCAAISLAGCTADQWAAFDNQIDNPESGLQTTAGTVGGIIETAGPVAKSVLPFIPYGNYILMALTAISGVCNFIQRIGKKKTDAELSKTQTAVFELVQAGQEFKLAAADNPAAVAAFKAVNNQAQSIETKKAVAVIKAGL